MQTQSTEEEDLLIPILNFHRRNNNSSSLKPTIEFVNKIHSRFAKNDKVFIDFCELMSMYQNKQVTINEVDSLLMELYQNDPDLYLDFTRFIPESEPSGSSGFVSQDTGNFIPEPEPSGSSGFVSQDTGNFVFTSSGNKGRGRSKEESLVMVIWETYKYELDLVYLRIKSTAKKLEGEHVKIEQLQSQDFKCIKLLYGRVYEEYGEAVVQLLLSKPDHNAPIIKFRMEKKCEEIEQHKILMERIWGEILEDIREGRKQVRHSCFLEKITKEWVNNCVY